MPTNEETSKESLGSAVTKKVEVVPYDTAWQPRFEELRLYLLGILEGQNARVEHVGSTSVPGLAAKPIRQAATSSSNVFAAPLPVPPSVKAGRMMHGIGISSLNCSSSSSE